MSANIIAKVEDKEYLADRFELSYFKSFSAITGLPTSVIQGGTLSFSIDWNLEATQDNFLASWMQEDGKLHDVTVDVNDNAQENVKINMKMTNAQIIGYNFRQTDSLDLKVQNTFLDIVLISPTISVGSANLNVQGQ